MEAMSGMEAIFRWMHVVAGIVWIGLLYFFNFVNVPLQAVIDGEAKKKVNPELLPRALYWFRWGAAWTWVTGVLLLMMVFYHGGLMFEGTAGWGGGAIAMVALTFAAPFIYDALVGIAALKNLQTLYFVGVALVALVDFLFATVGGFGYRALVIHTGTMFGTIMAFNVWFRIWPAQQKIVTAVKAGTPPDANLVALAGARSKHNTFMSVPLVWTMIDAHTAGPPFSSHWLSLIVMVALGWWITTMLYKRSAKVPGF